jgi:hypothetical protein
MVRGLLILPFFSADKNRFNPAGRIHPLVADSFDLNQA